jgi:putative spermidine/putrescine transport system permease protein
MTSAREWWGRNRPSAALAGLLVVLTALPLGLGLGYAAGYSLGLFDLVNPGLTLRHWARTLAEGEVLASLGYSLYVAAVTILFTVGLSLGLVLGLGPPGRRGWFTGVMYFPLAIPALVAGFYCFQLLSRSGLLSRVAYRLGWVGSLNDFPELVQEPYGIGLVTAHAFLATPFFTILFRNLYLHERGDELGQVARTLGASAWQSLRRVVVPLLLRRAAAPLLLYFIFVLGSYEIPLLLGTQSPQMVSVLAVRKLRGYDLADYPEGYVVVTLYAGLVLGLVPLLLRKRGE